MTTAALSAQHSRRAERALRLLAEEDPAFAVLSLWVQHCDMAEGLARASATTIFYGPRFDALSLPEQVGLAAHHILHVALGHAGRLTALDLVTGPAFQPALFNLCADALVNTTLEEAGFALPRPSVGLADLLSTVVPGAGQHGGPSLGGWDVEHLYRMLASGQDGKGTGGQQKDDAKWKRYAASKGFDEDLDPGGEATPGAEDSPASAAEWRQRISRALTAGRMAGRGLGALGQGLDDLPPVHTPWPVLLRRLLARSLIDVPRMAPLRPSRGFLARDAHARQTGAVTPGFEGSLDRRHPVPRLVVGLDMSSSVTDALLARFAAEVASIAARGGAELHLMLFDEEVRAHHRLRGRDVARQIADLRVARDGGTDFRPALVAAAALAPSAVVLLTDLDGPAGDAPRCPVIWATPEAPLSKPAFGTLVRLDA